MSFNSIRDYLCNTPTEMHIYVCRFQFYKRLSVIVSQCGFYVAKCLSIL